MKMAQENRRQKAAKELMKADNYILLTMQDKNPELRTDACASKTVFAAAGLAFLEQYLRAIQRYNDPALLERVTIMARGLVEGIPAEQIAKEYEEKEIKKGHLH